MLSYAKRDGKTCYGSVYAKTYKEVKEKLKKKQLQFDMPNQNIPYHTLTFRNLAEEWLISLQPQLKESSIVKYKNLLSSYLYPSFAQRNFQTITVEELNQFASTLLIKGGKNRNGLSPKTVSGILSVYKSILHYGTHMGIISDVNIDNIVIKQNPKSPCSIRKIPIPDDILN